MSAYIQFFIKTPERHIPIGTFSRVDYIFDFGCEIAPYEEVAPLERATVERIIHNADAKIRSLKGESNRIKNRMDLVMKSNNPLSEKLESLEVLEKVAGDLDKRTENAIAAKYYYSSLLEIIDEDNELCFGIEAEEF